MLNRALLYIYETSFKYRREVYKSDSFASTFNSTTKKPYQLLEFYAEDLFSSGQ